MAAYPGHIVPKESCSSPKLIAARKDSPVWLHWAYEYGGDVKRTVRYKEQIIGFKSTSQPDIQVLARRMGANCNLILEPSVPAPFNGRIGVISSNSTLVIHDLQYNDSSYQFLSTIALDIDVGSGSFPVEIDLKPIVTIKVRGMKYLENFVAFI